jgi:hypothetical protein
VCLCSQITKGLQMSLFQAPELVFNTVVNTVVMMDC